MSMHDSDSVGQQIDAVYRAERARLLARLIGVVGDFDLAEEALQDAFVAAVRTWPDVGVPDNPAGWLMTAAKRKAIDRIRRGGARERRQRDWGELSIAWTSGDPRDSMIDDRLRLIFTCCHPALGIEAQVALTLRSVGGLTTAEVASAFMVSESTLAQRLVRAKGKIRDTKIPYRVPPASQLSERLDAVLAVIGLIFNAGYLAGEGNELVRVDLCDEAKRLARLVIELLPGEAEAAALGALLCMQDARRAARVGTDGQPLTLEEQDRSMWDRGQILAGLQLLERSVSMAPPGPFALKASISAVHSSTRDAASTDWHAIIALYDQLAVFEPTPVVALNRAVAVAMAGTPADGLALLEDPTIAEPLASYHLFHSTRADLLRRSGHHDEAAVAYAQARGLTRNRAEHDFLDRRLAELGTNE